ncbi:hypothetical protein C4D60_Mb04t18120 [Musa balbisiana]|uniref:Protein S-acyltransferase n=1 Tax=Musa balbisiana TaxID=52838 RepID=A0A4S8KCV8_MUSBA|nr:hypothetical protein C4D60_Mb04t18120 [Musa balbisiana]
MRGYVTLPIIIVLTAIGYLYYTTLFVLIDGWLGLSTAAGFANAAVFNALAVVVVVTYGIAVFKDPGRVPDSFSPDIEHSESPIHEIKRKVLLVGSASYALHNDQEHNAGSFNISYIICGILLLPLTIALIVLLGWHIYLILQNKTTIEYHEGVKAMWLAEKVGNVYRHPYDLGIYENLMWVLGPSILCWFCPVTKNLGSGLRFRTAYDVPLSTFPS